MKRAISQILIPTILCGLFTLEPSAIEAQTKVSITKPQWTTTVRNFCSQFIRWVFASKEDRLQRERAESLARLKLYLRQNPLPYDRLEVQRIAFWEDVLDKALATQTPLEVLAPHPKTGIISPFVLSLQEIERLKGHLVVSTHANQQHWSVSWSEETNDRVPLHFVFLRDSLPKQKLKEVEKLFELYLRMNHFYVSIETDRWEAPIAHPLTFDLATERQRYEAFARALGFDRSTKRLATDTSFEDFRSWSYPPNLDRIHALALEVHPQAWEDIIRFITNYCRKHFKQQISEIPVSKILSQLSDEDVRLHPSAVFHQDHAQPEIPPPLSHETPTVDFLPTEPPFQHNSPQRSAYEIQRLLLPLKDVSLAPGIRAKAHALDQLFLVIGAGAEKVTPAEILKLKQETPEFYVEIKRIILGIMDASARFSYFRHGYPHKSIIEGFLHRTQHLTQDDWNANRYPH